MATAVTIQLYFIQNSSPDEGCLLLMATPASVQLDRSVDTVEMLIALLEEWSAVAK